MNLKLYYEVTKKGKKITQAKTWVDRSNTIEQLVYYYDDKHYIEIRNNGLLRYFSVMIGG